VQLLVQPAQLDCLVQLEQLVLLQQSQDQQVLRVRQVLLEQLALRQLLLDQPVRQVQLPRFLDLLGQLVQLVQRDQWELLYRY
jgi:hypothetical protein